MTRCTIFALLLAAGATPTPAFAQTAASATSPVEAPDPLAAVWDARDWASAVELLEARVEDRSESVDAWYRLGVARALNADAAGAAEAFRRVRQLAPSFPGIDDDIAAAEARAARDADEAVDTPGVLADAAVRADVRSSALDDGWWLSGARLELVSALGEAPAADARAWALEGDAAAAAEAADAALGAAPDEPRSYASAARAWLRAGDIDRARYYLDLYETLGGDPAEAGDLYDALRGTR